MEDESRNKDLHKKALLLEYFTICWHIVEGPSSIAVGLFLGSISLVAYGLEAIVEVFSAGVVVWRLKGAEKVQEKTAVRLIGMAYLIVGAYILVYAVVGFLQQEHPQRSFVGIILMIVMASVMAVLGLSKRKVGLKLRSQTVLADAKFTLLDAALSSTVLVGLAFNTFLGWWWMDQATALFLSAAAFREGMREIL